MGLIGDYGRVRATLHEAERRKRAERAAQRRAEHPEEEPVLSPGPCTSTYEPARVEDREHPTGHPDLPADVAALRTRFGL